MKLIVVFEYILKDEYFIFKKDKIKNCIIMDDNLIIYKILMKLVEIYNYFIELCLLFVLKFLV